MQELDLLDSYDMVLHLVTAADGCPEYYTLENNQARTETVEEAIALDKNTQDAWLGHSRLVIIDNSTDFDNKINRALENIYQLLHPSYSIRYQKKYLIDLNESVYSFLDKVGANVIDIEQTYLQSEQEHYERNSPPKRRSACVQYNSEGIPTSPYKRERAKVSRFDRASNRRAAGRYIPNA